MGIIKILKGNNINDTANNDTDIYPVTSVKAIYDINNTSLDNIINNIENDATKVKSDLIAFKESQIGINTAVTNNIENVKNDINSMSQDMQDIEDEIAVLENNLENVKSEKSYFVASISTVASEATRGEQHSIAEYCSVSETKCTLGTSIDINTFKNGDIFIPKNKGKYIFGDVEINVNDYGFIQKQNDTFIYISLGIPMPTEEDYGKCLIAGADGLYWGNLK